MTVDLHSLTVTNELNPSLRSRTTVMEIETQQGLIDQDLKGIYLDLDPPPPKKSPIEKILHSSSALLALGLVVGSNFPDEHIHFLHSFWNVN